VLVLSCKSMVLGSKAAKALGMRNTLVSNQTVVVLKIFILGSTLLISVHAIG